MKLKINNLEASIEKKVILKDFDLQIDENQIHVIMGPNGSGKSTLSKILAGHPAYQIHQGSIFFHDKNLLDLAPEERSHEGLFLAFQSPLEIAGVSNYDFLRLAYNQKQKFLGKPELTPIEFLSVVQEKAKELKVPGEFLSRDLNQGFSGGEKKKNEILQMILLEPDFIILDELDSGLDVDAMKILCQSILKNRSPKSSLLIITHYPRILNYFQPDFVHILINGKIVKTGKIELVEQIEQEGYQSFLKSS